MKKMPIMLLIISIVVINKGSGVNLPGNLAYEYTKASEVNTDTPKIPLVAILAIPENLTNVSRYKQLRASGITYSYYSFSNANAMQAALDVGEKTGIKLFVACPELTSDPETTVRRFMNHPALAGYFLSDEPSRGRFPKLGELVKRIRAIDDKHLCYINLFPNYQVEKYLGTRTYDEYLDHYLKEVPSQVISFDNYPITGPNRESVRKEFYKNLEVVSAASKKSGRPFWGFALSVTQPPFPVPTLGALKLQVYSNLAYGAQGIEYFTYWTPATPQFKNAAIGKDGKETEVYPRLQQVNKEVTALSGVFLGAKMISVVHTGEVLPPGTKPLTNLPKPIASLKTDGIGALVSVMENNGKSYLVIVNHDFTAPMSMLIKCMPGVSRIQKDGSAVSQNLYTNKVTIDPGDVAIYSWPDSLN